MYVLMFDIVFAIQCLYGGAFCLWEHKETYSNVMCQSLLFRVANIEENPPWPTQALALLGGLVFDPFLRLLVNL